MIERLLLKLRLRDRVSEQEAAALAELMQPMRRIPAGAEIAVQGAHPQESTLLIRGLTGRVHILRDGERQISGLHVAGDFVDLHSFLLARMDHSVVALSACTISAARHEDLRRLTADHPHLTRMLWSTTLIDAAIHRQWLVGMGRKSALAQTAHLICEQYARLKVVDLVERETFQFPLSQGALADVLGLSAVHVNRVVQELRAEGLVRWRSGEVEILDWPRLTGLAQFDPTYLQLERHAL